MQKKSMVFIVCILTLLFLSIEHTQAQTPQQTLNQYIVDLQKNPNDYALREKIIRYVQTMKPKPAIPEEARKHFVMAQTLQKKATDTKCFELAIIEYKEALLIAPWWPEAYNNMGILMEQVGQYDEAMRALKLYVLTNPKDAREAQDKIYAIEAAAKIAELDAMAKRKAEEAKRKEVDLSGTWYNDSDCWRFKFKVTGNEVAVTNYCSDEHIDEGIYGWAVLIGRTFKGTIREDNNWGAGMFEGVVSEDNKTLRISIKDKGDSNWRTIWNLYRK